MTSNQKKGLNDTDTKQKSKDVWSNTKTSVIINDDKWKFRNGPTIHNPSYDQVKRNLS